MTNLSDWPEFGEERKEFGGGQVVGKVFDKEDSVGFGSELGARHAELEVKGDAMMVVESNALLERRVKAALRTTTTISSAKSGEMVS